MHAARRILLGAMLCLVLGGAGHGQTTMQGSASLAFGGNTWGGTVVSGGLESGGDIVDFGMKQQSTWLPQWVDTWEPNPTGPGIYGGQAVSWTTDFPAVGGVNRCTYRGNVRIVWWFGMFQSIYIDYVMNQAYIPNPQ